MKIDACASEDSKCSETKVKGRKLFAVQLLKPCWTIKPPTDSFTGKSRKSLNIWSLSQKLSASQVDRRVKLWPWSNDGESSALIPTDSIWETRKIKKRKKLQIDSFYGM